MAREERGRCLLLNLLIQKLGISHCVHHETIEREQAYDLKTKVKSQRQVFFIIINEPQSQRFGIFFPLISVQIKDSLNSVWTAGMKGDLCVSCGELCMNVTASVTSAAFSRPHSGHDRNVLVSSSPYWDH